MEEYKQSVILKEKTLHRFRKDVKIDEGGGGKRNTYYPKELNNKIHNQETVEMSISNHVFIKTKNDTFYYVFCVSENVVG